MISNQTPRPTKRYYSLFRKVVLEILTYANVLATSWPGTLYSRRGAGFAVKIFLQSGFATAVLRNLRTDGADPEHLESVLGCRTHTWQVGFSSYRVPPAETPSWEHSFRHTMRRKYNLFVITRLFSKSRLRWAVRVAWMEEGRSGFKIIIGTSVVSG